MTETSPAEDADVPTRLRVDTASRSYDIIVGEDLIGDAARYLEPVMSGRRVAVVSDENVAGRHLAKLCASLDGAGIERHEIILPPGEASKSFAQLECLLDALLEARIERGDMVIALGGGVIGDLAGFAASILRRGVAVAQMPTTLLAQVDSSVGGKTGIDTRFGKNLVGSFHQPHVVLADISVLDTLPRRELLAGYGEVVKYGLIDDLAFFEWLEANGAALLRGDHETLRQAVTTSCLAKARIVAEDERETGARALLNLGHTFAHAIELAVGYDGGVVHGEAVAIGEVLAFDLSVRLGICPPEDAARLRRHLVASGLPTTVGQAMHGDADADAVADRLVAIMGQDKKMVAGRVTFVLARGIGRAFLEPQVDLDAVRRVIADSYDEDVPTP
jgi:3-dehydroquinate synthase